jgi:hypothetical protein
MNEDEVELTFVETTPADDVIPGRSPRPPTRWTMRPWWLVVLVAAMLAAGIGIGYAVGRHTSKPATAPESSSPAESTPTPAGSVLTELPRLNTTGSVCSVQPPGTRQLMLGIEVQNGDTMPIQFHYVRGVFPMGGLRTVDAAVGHCSVPGVPVPDYWLAPGGTTWLRITVDVLVGCPQPLPVHYQVDYAVDGSPSSVTLPSFPDLANVHYSGC